VTSFLENNGVHRHSHRISANDGFLEVTIPVAIAEEMLGTTFITFEHRVRGLSYVRAIKPHRVPEIEQHIDFIGGLTHLPNVPITGHSPSSPPQLANMFAPQQRVDGGRRRMDEAEAAKEADSAMKIFNGASKPASAAQHLQMANPLSWRGLNISMMVMPR
jgi:hypothetical protein